MNTLQTAAPVTSAAAASASGDAPTTDERDALPWLAAFQAAIAHIKGGKAVPGHGKDSVDATDTSDVAASDADDKPQTTEIANTSAMPCSPLTLIAALPPAPPAATLASPTPCGNAPHEDDALSTTPGTLDGQMRVAVERPSTDNRGTVAMERSTADAVASPDALKRTFELANAREDHRRDVQALPQFALGHSAIPPVAASAATPAAQSQINAAVGSAGWGAELGQKIVWLIGAKEHIAELRLNPPDLGPLDIKLTVNEHETTAVFTSPHGAVRDAVESALPRLREVLADSGIMLGNASVTSDTPHDGSAFAAPNGQGQRGHFNPSGQDSIPGPAQPAAVDLIRRNGLVDLFA
jgi:flagellar hook-length control protein FliK